MPKFDVDDANREIKRLSGLVTSSAWLFFMNEALPKLTGNLEAAMRSADTPQEMWNISQQLQGIETLANYPKERLAALQTRVKALQ